MSGVLCETVEQTRNALVLWGEWTRSDVPVKKCGNALAIHKFGRDFSKREEEQALMIDHLVARLGKSDPAAGKAIQLCYVQQLSLRDAAKRLGVSFEKARMITSTGLYWISGAMHSPSERSLELMARLGLEVLG